MQLLILTGMSGSGKHTAFKIFEDFGYYCVDNLPVQLLSDFVELAWRTQDERPLVAVGIDIRSGDTLPLLREILTEMDGEKKSYRIIFLDAEDEILLKRYKETRRNHPLAGEGRILSGVEKERESLQFLRERADYVIDTSHLLVRDLRSELRGIFMEHEEYKSLNITVLSFGFKYGIPTDADLVFDVRFLPNPYYDTELRPKTGDDPDVREFVMRGGIGEEFLKHLESMLLFLIPHYIDEGKNQLVIAVGCTGGRHRSVAIANEIYGRLSEKKNFGLKCEHRDIGK